MDHFVGHPGVSAAERGYAHLDRGTAEGLADVGGVAGLGVLAGEVGVTQIDLVGQGDIGGFVELRIAEE
jgi:hypothetical protein